MMHWDDGGMMDWGGGLVGELLVLILLVLAAVGVMALLRGWRSGKLNPGQRGSEQILDERLARGEIDIEEYARVRNLLDSGR